MKDIFKINMSIVSRFIEIVRVRFVPEDIGPRDWNFGVVGGWWNRVQVYGDGIVWPDCQPDSPSRITLYI